MQHRRNYWNTAVFLLVMVMVLPLHAQQTTATLSGVVKDVSGAVVPNASVKVTRLETGETHAVNTDSAGYYFVPLLPIGEYQIKVDAAGFREEVINGILLEVGQAAVANATVQVGRFDQLVTVTGQAPIVDTTTPTVSGVISSQQLSELPLNGRDYMQLAKNQQGVSWYRSTNGSSQTAGIGSRIAVGGARDDENLFLMDGTIINDISNSTPGGADQSSLGVDAIAEFQILTNAYSAEFGRNAGGVINIVTKSGGNVFHGNLFAFDRNDVFDTKNYFVGAGQPKPPFKRNQFGGLLSGPIFRNKTFFLGTYEGLRESEGLSDTVNVPNQLAREGILPTAKVTVSPLMQPYVALYPLPTPGGHDNGNGTAQYLSAPQQPTNENYYVGRIDHTFNEKDQAFGRYTLDFSLRAVPDADQLFSNNFLVHNQYLTLGEQHVFSPRVFNTFRFGFSRSHSDEYPTSIQSLSPSLSFIAGQPLGQINITGGPSTLGTPTIGPRNYAYNVFEIQEHVNVVKGRHSLRFGGNFDRYQDNENGDFESAGTYTFSSLANFLQDKASTLELQLPTTDAIRHLRQDLAGMYIQDEFRVSPRISLSAGVRYEFITVLNEVSGKLANLRDITDPATTIGPYFKNPSWRNVSPRLGVAWDPFGDGKTSVRLGLGLFYDEVLSVYTNLPATRQPPFFEQADLTNPPFPNPLPALVGISPALRLESINYNLQTPRRFQDNFSIQHDLPGNMTFNIGYVGSLGRHLITYVDEGNTAYPTILPGGIFYHAAGLSRRNPNFANVGTRTSNGNSSYHALQTGINRRLIHNLLLQFSYTYSKYLTDGDIVEAGTNDDNSFIVTNPDHFQKGLSEFNIKHTAVFNHVLVLPFGTGQRWGSDWATPARAVISGWEWNGILTLASGPAFTPVLGFDQARQFTRSAGGGQRPNLIPGCHVIQGGVTNYFNPNCFSVPTPGYYGNMPPNDLVGPGYESYDLGLSRKLAIGEKYSLQFRGEIFNIFNHPNFDVPSSNTVFTAGAVSPQSNPGIDAVLNTAAGQITRTVSASRQVQFGLKFLF
jgi:hypothetical protein